MMPHPLGSESSNFWVQILSLLVVGGLMFSNLGEAALRFVSFTHSDELSEHPPQRFVPSETFSAEKSNGSLAASHHR